MPYAPDTYHLTAEQVTLKQETHRFAEEVLRPAGMELDAQSPEEVIAPGSQLREVFQTAYRAEYHLRGFPERLRGRCGKRQVEGATAALTHNGGAIVGGGAASMCITILTR